MLPECQSPTEAFFNPHSVTSRRSSPVFFPESCQMTYQSSSDGGGIGRGDSDAKAVLSDVGHAVGLESESLLGNVWLKSLHPRGCREVQEALSNGDNRTRVAIASEMHGHFWEAVESPHANHVLQKCIVELPPEASQPIIDELMSRRDAAARLARHRYGCRIVERLLEHCWLEQLREMIYGILAEVESLCVHPFGNFVIQHLFEYGSEDAKRQLALAVLDRMPKLSADPRGVTIVAKGLEFAPVRELLNLARILLRTPAQLVQLATQRHGHCVALALVRMKHPEGAEARECFNEKEARQTLSSSRHGRVVIKAFDSV